MLITSRQIKLNRIFHLFTSLLILLQELQYWLVRLDLVCLSSSWCTVISVKWDWVRSFHGAVTDVLVCDIVILLFLSSLQVVVQLVSHYTKESPQNSNSVLTTVVNSYTRKSALKIKHILHMWNTQWGSKSLLYRNSSEIRVCILWHHDEMSRRDVQLIYLA